MVQGCSQEFSTGGVTLSPSEGTHQIFMSFSPPVVGCLRTKGLQNGGRGGGGVTSTLGTPSYAPPMVFLKKRSADEFCAFFV